MPRVTTSPTLTTKDVADRLGVHPFTVVRWIKAGELPAFQSSTKAPYRIDAADLDAFVARKKVTT